MARTFDSVQAKWVFAGIVVTTLGGIVVAWIQFGWGFGSQSSDTFRGEVNDGLGEVYGAEVNWESTESPQTKFTDDRGKFEVTAQKNRPFGRLKVTAFGYKTFDRDITFIPKGTYIVSLERNQPRPTSLETPSSPAPVAENTLPNKESAHSGLTLTTDAVKTTNVGPQRNYFLESKSPKMWFDEAKYYRRVDQDPPTKKLEKETPKLSFVRRYFSADSAKITPIGLGWHHPYESHIDIGKSTLTKIIFRDEYQRITEFQLMHDATLAISELKQFFPAASKETRLFDLLTADEQKGDSYFLPSVKNLKYMGVNMEGGAQLSFQREFLVIRLVDNTVYLFDHQGRMRQIIAPNESKLELRYDPERPERLARITTTSGPVHFMDLRYGNNGMIISVAYDDQTTFFYAYDQQKRLTTVKKDEMELYRYGYDAAGRLASVRSPGEERELEIRYNDVGWRVHLQRGEKAIEWIIDDSPEVPKITTKRYDDSVSESIDYSFDESTQTLTMAEEGESPVSYHLTQCGCKPLDITRDGETTHFAYDELGRLVKKESPTRVTSYTYDTRSGKVASVTERDAGSQGESNIAFTYDPQGNLTEANKNDGKSIRLGYDPQNKIASIEDREHRQIALTYNERGKPIVVHLKGVGIISVTYKNASDEIEKVEGKAEDGTSDSANNQKVALAVRTVFQELLELLKPAKIGGNAEYSRVRATL